MLKIKLKDKIISDVNRPYVIAEIGSNFNQSINQAYKLIDIAKKCKADAAKFQLFRAKSLYPNNKKMFKIFKSVELNPNWIKLLKEYCRKKNIHFLVSPFDQESLQVLKKNNLFAYKIASSEATNFKLINNIAKTHKPIFLSTGMCDLDDVRKAIKLINNKNIVLMQCYSSYPLQEKDTNLNVLSTYKKNFNVILGYSDHTLGVDSAIVALGLGARVFEKHITLNKKMKGPDHFYAMEPGEFTDYVFRIHEAYKMLGRSEKDLIKFEKKFGRREGLYFKKNLSLGQKIYKSAIEIKKPARGMRSKYINKILNKKLKKKAQKGQPITVDYFK